MFDLGFQNEAKTQIRMSKMQSPNLGFYFFQIYADVELFIFIFLYKIEFYSNLI